MFAPSALRSDNATVYSTLQSRKVEVKAEPKILQTQILFQFLFINYFEKCLGECLELKLESSTGDSTIGVFNILVYTDLTPKHIHNRTNAITKSIDSKYTYYFNDIYSRDNLCFNF